MALHLPRDHEGGETPARFTEQPDNFDTSEHSTYTEEEPSALTPDEVQVFLGTMREMFPQHYAMTSLAFAAGLRDYRNYCAGGVLVHNY